MNNKQKDFIHTSKFYKEENNNENNQNNDMFLTMKNPESHKKNVNIIFDESSNQSEDIKTREINQNEYHDNNKVFNNNNNNNNNVNINTLPKEEIIICEIPGNSKILKTKTNPAFPIESKISFKEDFYSPKISGIIEEKENENENEKLKSKINSNIKGSIIVGPKNLTTNLELITGSYLSHNGEDSYFPCFMCDKFYQINENNFPGNVCPHIFCSKCGKFYYEELIDNNEIKMKCPKFKCQSILTNDLIKKIVSRAHYDKLIQNIEKTERSSKNQFNLENSIIEENEKQKKELQNYIYEHVIDVNSNKKFYLFNKAKVIYCNKCYEPALYSKSGNNFIKCLNCGITICRYCFKPFIKDHLVISNENHCKVYLRKRYISLKKPNCFSDFLRELGLVIISFIMLFIGLFCSIHTCLSCGKRISNICVKIIITLFSLLFTIIFSPFILILFPYFPVFNEIFY